MPWPPFFLGSVSQTWQLLTGVDFTVFPVFPYPAMLAGEFQKYPFKATEIVFKSKCWGTVLHCLRHTNICQQTGAKEKQGQEKEGEENRQVLKKKRSDCCFLCTPFLKIHVRIMQEETNDSKKYWVWWTIKSPVIYCKLLALDNSFVLVIFCN